MCRVPKNVRKQQKQHSTCIINANFYNSGVSARSTSSSSSARQVLMPAHLFDEVDLLVVQNELNIPTRSFCTTADATHHQSVQEHESKGSRISSSNNSSDLNRLVRNHSLHNFESFDTIDKYIRTDCQHRSHVRDSSAFSNSDFQETPRSNTQLPVSSDRAHDSYSCPASPQTTTIPRSAAAAATKRPLTARVTTPKFRKEDIM